MANANYTLRYLPLFYEELEENIIYIAEKIQNLPAANSLLVAVEKAILDRLPNAEAFEPYHSLKDRNNPYYRISIKNFVIYYVVINNEDTDNIMEIRRFLYNKQ